MIGVLNFPLHFRHKLNVHNSYSNVLSYTWVEEKLEASKGELPWS